MKKVRQKTPTDDDIKTHVPGMSQLINTRDDCVETSPSRSIYVYEEFLLLAQFNQLITWSEIQVPDGPPPFPSSKS
jgi:hypothetical protein